MIRPLFLITSFVICLILPAATFAQTSAQSQQLAEKLVNNVLQAKPNDVVVISTDTTHMPLVEQLVTSLRRVGAYAITDIGTNNMGRLYFKRVPSRFDSQQPMDLIRLASIANALVTIDYAYDPSILRGVAPSRINAQNQAFTAYQQYVLKRNIPNIDIGNGIMPSAGTAATYGVPEAALSTMFWNGVNADYSQIKRDAQRMSAMASGAHTVHITASNGTNFTFRTVSGGVTMNTGTISAEDRRKGGAAMAKQLPAGDVYVYPAPGLARGVLVLGTAPFLTENVVGMRIRFSNGKMASMSASSGGDAVKAQYNIGSAGRDQFSWADFGVNRSMSVPAGNWGAGPSMAAGFVTVGMGSSLSQGGSNRSSFFFGSNVPNATVTVDGRPVITNGRLDF